MSSIRNSYSGSQPQQSNIIKQWTAKRNICLDELHRHDGLSWSAPIALVRECENLLAPTSSFRCLDCIPHAYNCESCLVEMHLLTPFHRIEVRPTSNVQSRILLIWNAIFTVLEQRVLVQDDSIRYRACGEPRPWRGRLVHIPNARCATYMSSTPTGSSSRSAFLRLLSHARRRRRALYPTASQQLVPLHNQDSKFGRNFPMPRLHLPSE